VEPSKYLKHLCERIKSLGGTLEQKKLTSLSDGAMVSVQHRDTLTTAHRPDFIVNCSGLGAKVLAGDSKVFPVRGQILRVLPKQPTDSRHRISRP
jgi:D-amino-acid oxidase